MHKTNNNKVMGMQNGLYSGRRCPIQLKVSLLQD